MRALTIIGVCLLAGLMTGCGGGYRSGSLPPSSSTLSYNDLFSSSSPAAPAEDGAFAMPGGAAAPPDTFEGKLELSNPGGKGSFQTLLSTHGQLSDMWKHLPDFSFEFVQDGIYLIPAQQGLVYTGNPVWNYIVGPGLVWQQSDDSGYSRASFPFALIERNQNCVHNGEMAFLFSNSKSPNISEVRYQVTKETCEYMQFNMWGQLPATYTHYAVTNDAKIKTEAAAERANRLPTKPLSADFPGSGVDPAGFVRDFAHPENITLYGLLINGVNYVSDCKTRFGQYAFCSEMRLPSYSTAKSALNGLAMMRLGQLYGSGVYSQLIRNYVPEHVDGGDWTSVTFSNGSDMATGNYQSAGYMVDANGAADTAFLMAETYSAKAFDAFNPYPHQAPPGMVWVYQNAAAFITNQAMNAYLQQQQGGNADIFNMLSTDVYETIGISKGGQTTLRTDNSPTGKVVGALGLFYITDDVAKIAKFMNNDNGAANGDQLLDPQRLRESLFRDPAALGLPVPDVGTPAVPNTRRYSHNFWAKKITPTEYPQFKCTFWAPYMNGFGGINIVLLPNGATFYVFSDGDESKWSAGMTEANKLSPICH
jgi:hypothetical protein